MLSRVAERVYWTSRYMERAENLARLINVTSSLLLDIPQGTQVSWATLLSVVGDDEALVEAKDVRAQEQMVMKLLISDINSSASIMNCLSYARENARTTREIIPSETWELMNDLYLFAKEHASKSLSRTARQTFLREIIDRIQQYTGLLEGSMSHTSAYEFIRLGRKLERADMTTRMLDVGAVNLVGSGSGDEEETALLMPYDSLLWMNVLQSLSAYQMYRQHVRHRVNGKDVVSFLLQDQQFPRAVFACLDGLQQGLEQLPHNEKALQAIAAAGQRIQKTNVQKLFDQEKLHSFIDKIQMDISMIHNQIVAAWFLPRTPVNNVETISES